MFQAQPNSRYQGPQSLPYIRTIPFGSNSTGLMYLQRHYVFCIELLDLKIALKFDCQIVIGLQHITNMVEYFGIVTPTYFFWFFCAWFLSLYTVSPFCSGLLRFSTNIDYCALWFTSTFDAITLRSPFFEL